MCLHYGGTWSLPRIHWTQLRAWSYKGIQQAERNVCTHRCAFNSARFLSTCYDERCVYYICLLFQISHYSTILHWQFAYLSLSWQKATCGWHTKSVWKVMPPQKYLVQLVWPWSGICANLFTVPWASTCCGVQHDILSGLSYIQFKMVLPLKPCMHLSSHPYVPHVLPISVFLIWSPEWYVVRSTVHKAPSSSLLPSYLVALRPRYPPQHSVFENLQPTLFGGHWV